MLGNYEVKEGLLDCPEVGLKQGKFAGRDISVKTKHGQRVPPDMKMIAVKGKIFLV